MTDDTKRCVVVYALRGHQWSWSVELPAEATIEDALACARAAAKAGSGPPLDVPWDSAATGIHGEVQPRSAVPLPGDRIEIYRPLAADPKESRRARVKRSRR